MWSGQRLVWFHDAQTLLFELFPLYRAETETDAIGAGRCMGLVWRNSSMRSPRGESASHVERTVNGRGRLDAQPRRFIARTQ